MTDNIDPISKKILPLALPMAATQLVTVGSSFLCMTMLASLGRDVLAASALIYSTQISVMVIGMSLLLSLSVLISHAFGAKQYSAVGQFLQQGWTLAILISIPLMIFFWYIKSILMFFGQAERIADIVQTFFRAHEWRVTVMLLAVCNQQLCYGVHKQRVDIITNIIGVIILLSSAYILIFGKFGLPPLGVAGLGYAIAIQGWFYFLFTTFIFSRSEFFKPFNIFQYRVHTDLSKVAQMFRVGWPISIQVSGEMLSFFVSAAMVGWLGVTALAAYQVTTQYLFLIIIPIFALAQASGVLIGQAMGSQQYSEIGKIGTTSVRIALLMCLGAATIFLLFPSHLAAMYLNIRDPANARTLHMIVMLFAVIAASLFFDASRNVLTGGLRGLFDTRFPMVIGLIVIWIIGLPLGYLLAFVFKLGVIGIPLGSLIGMMIGAIAIWLRWQTKLKQLPTVIKSFPPYHYQGLIIRLFEEDDLPYARNWRNHNGYRFWFKSTNFITKATHQAWYRRYLQTENDYMFIVTDAAGIRYGLFALYEIDHANKKGTLGRLLVNPEHEGKGMMKAATQAAIAFAKEILQLSVLELEVKRNNHRALHIYQACGFVVQSKEDDEWQQMILIL